MPTDRELARALGLTLDAYEKQVAVGLNEAPSDFRRCDITERRFGAEPYPKDCSEAVLRAQDAAVKNGGEVYIPPGQWRLRRPVVFPAGGSGNGEKAVYLRGAGPGLSQVLWDPLPAHVGADMFKWGSPNQHYYYGGLSDVSLRAIGGSTGKLVYLQRTIRSVLRDVELQENHRGHGLVIDTGFPQNILLDNVEFLSCRVGLEVAEIGQLTMLNVRFNGCWHRDLLIHNGGTIAWFGGMIQGGAFELDGVTPREIAIEVGTEAAVGHFGVYGPIHIETRSKTIFRLLQSTHFEARNPTWAAVSGETFVHATDGVRGIELSHIDVPTGAVLVKARNQCFGVIHDAEPDATKYDLDNTCRFELERASHWYETAKPVIVGAVWR